LILTLNLILTLLFQSDPSQFPLVSISTSRHVRASVAGPLVVWAILSALTLWFPGCGSWVDFFPFESIFTIDSNYLKHYLAERLAATEKAFGIIHHDGLDFPL